jgi:predicted transcriptional regulator
MMAKSRPPLSEAELRVMKVLWEHGPGTVRQLSSVLNRRGRRWAYTTVLTLLQRLQAKGFAKSDASNAAHVFHAATSRDDLIRLQLKNVADQLCGGAPAPLLLALVESHRFSPEDLARFRGLIDALEAKEKAEGRGGARR